MTSQKEKDKGIMFALMERFNKFRQPHAQDLLKKVESGELLSERDRRLINDVMEDRSKIQPILDRNPEYKELAAEAIDMWNEIIEKDLENRKKQK